MERPEIRFKGYTDEWEQRKLGDVTESIKNGYTYKADGSREHLYKITRIESISSGAINIEKLGSSDNVNENYKLEDGDILFSHINSLPYIANTAIYTSNLGEIYHGMNLLNIRAKHEIIDSHFLLHLLKKESSRNWFRIIAKPAVNQASISTTEVSSFVFMMPNMEEQKRISSVLDNIDNLLTLHQRKCDEVKSLKKYMLQKMFPQNEQKVPEIRFEGFTEAWEQRKFGEITELKSASRVHKDEWTSNGVPFYRSSDVMAAINGTENEKAFISEELYEKLSKVSGKLEEGDILVTGGGSVGNPYIVPDNKSLYTKDADLLWIKNKGKFHPYFLYEFFFSPTFRNYLGSISHVGTIAHYTITQLSDTPICLPSFEEQKEVGEYFQSLDHLITLHQQKCEELKKIKKFMLQKMFV